MLENNLQGTELDSHPICCSLLVVGCGPWKPSHLDSVEASEELVPNLLLQHKGTEHIAVTTESLSSQLYYEKLSKVPDVHLLEG